MSRRRDLSLLVGAVGLSALGDYLALVPLALHLADTTGSGVVVALLFVAVWSPAIVLVGPAGLLADRFDPRRVLVVVSLAQVVVALALAFSHDTVPVLLLAALLGCGFALSQPAEFALVPLVAGDDLVGRANGRVETARYVGFTVGPLVGGVLAGAGGMQLAMLVNAASFVVVAAVAAVLRGRRADAHADAAAAGRARDGVAYLLREPTLAVVMTVAFVSLLFMTASTSAAVFFAVDVLEIGEIGYGVLIGVWTLGMALGATFVAPRVASSLLAVVAVVMTALQGLGIALPAVWLVAALAYVAFLVGGVAHGTKNVLVRTLMHERVPAPLHGRAFAAYNGLRNLAELFAILGGGLLVAAAGPRWTLFVAGAVPLAAAAGTLVVARRRLAREVPEVPAPV